MGSNLLGYMNPGLQDVLNKYITQEKYGEFKAIIDEIMQRRAFEFDFSIERMTEEIERLANNLTTIRFMTDDEIKNKTTDDTMAVFKAKEKSILIDPEYYKKYSEYYGKHFEPKTAKYLLGREMYALLTHEVYHAINYRENGDFGIIHQYKNGAISGSHMNEIVTESAATRTTMTKSNEDYQKGYMGTTGYQTTTCITNLLALAVGVSEKELLKHSMYDRAEFETFLKDALSTSFEEYETDERISEVIIASMAIGTIEKDTDPRQKCAIYSQMYNVLFELAADHMLADKREPTRELMGEKQFRTQKMLTIAASSLEFLEREGFIEPGYSTMIVERSGMLQSVRTMQESTLRDYAVYAGMNPYRYSFETLDDLVTADIRENKEEYADGFEKYIVDDYTQRTTWSDGVFIYTSNVLDKELTRPKGFLSTENVDIKPHTITDGMFRKEKTIKNQRNEDEGR